MSNDAPDKSKASQSSARLRVLSSTKLLDSAPDESFDRLTRLAARTLKAPVSLVSLVDDKRQFFKSAYGLSEPWASRRETPLLLSFCQHAVRTGEALIVHNASRDARFRDHPAITELGVIAYAGVPLKLSRGHTVGALCVIDSRVRRWSPQQIRVLRDLGGSVVSEVELRLQIHESAQARQASEESETRLRLLLESTGEGIYGVDRDGCCTFLNRAAAEMLGYTREQIVERNMHELMHHSYPDGRPYPVEACRVYQAFRTGVHTHVQDEALWRKDGSHFDAEYWAYPIFRGSKVTGAVVNFRDITRRKRNEAALAHYTRQLEESDRRKDEFLAVLGHELRNPLAAISATAELLAVDPSAGDDTQSAGKAISEQVGLLTGLLDDLLDVGRITRGKIQLKRETSSVAAIIDKAATSVQPLIAAREHSLVTKIADGLYANVDALRLKQVLVNLLTNAAKYTNPGGHIRIRAGSEGDDVWLSVKDNGYGIRPELQSAIFKPFTQAGTGTSYTGGLGIGLTLVKRLVELHGGAVTMTSAGAGLGSEFTVHLVGALAEAPPAASAVGKLGPSQASHGASPAWRILVVDDNRAAADGIARLLASDGFDALAVYCGLDALEKARAIHFDAMLVDIALPDMSGYEVAKRVRADVGRGNTMLIALSGFGHAEARVTARKSGFDHHMAKPANLDQLKRLLLGKGLDR